MPKREHTSADHDQFVRQKLTDPSPEIPPDIRELYERADWPEGEFRIANGRLIAPDGLSLTMPTDLPEESARAAFICEVANYWLRHLRGGADREQARLRTRESTLRPLTRVAAAKGQTP